MQGSFKRRALLRGAALALAALLVVPAHAAAATIEEVQDRQQQLQQENEELQQKIDALKEDEDAALAYQAELAGEIDEKEAQIDQARATIQEMDEKITALESKLALARQQYQSTIDMFSDRLFALYTSGSRSISTLEILLNSKSFTDFFLKQQLIEASAQQDQAMLDKLAEYEAATRQDRDDLAEAQRQVADSKKAIEAAQEELEVLYAENDALVASLESQQAQAREQIAQNESEDAELQAQLEALIEERNRQEEELRQQQAQNGAVQAPGGTGVDPVTPGLQSGFAPIWPLPGVGLGNITGHFGDMYFNGPHNGLDIGAAYGTPIVAAQAGEVISAEYHWSWGNNVLIWHNETFSTRCAHMSSIAVTPGQYVEQGQIIGYVGSTGQSFGNHLHFEVYYNGVRVNPDPYLGI